MHDIKSIRENPAAFDAALAKRNVTAKSAEILKLDEEKRKAQKEINELLAQRNQFAKKDRHGESQGRRC